MRLTAAETTLPQLSCYTTNLVCYLAPEIPAVPRLFARATRLAVRTDLPPGELAFSHHTRVDVTAAGGGLAYRGSAEWEETRSGLLAELAAHGRVLAVGNTAHLTWAPGSSRPSGPHWITIHGQRNGSWKVADHFAALTPHGEQEEFLGWLEDPELARVLTPVTDPAPETVRRDRLALGQATAVPPAGHYRWLVRGHDAPPAMGTGKEERPYDGAPDEGVWLFDPVAVLVRLRAVMLEDPRTPARYADDLWAAGRHYAHRYAVLVSDGLLAPAAAAAAAGAWQELPRTLRFAAQSAARGRPRPGVIEQAFVHLLRATEALDTAPPQEG